MSLEDLQNRLLGRAAQKEARQRVMRDQDGRGLSRQPISLPTPPAEVPPHRPEVSLNLREWRKEFDAAVEKLGLPVPDPDASIADPEVLEAVFWVFCTQPSSFPTLSGNVLRRYVSSRRTVVLDPEAPAAAQIGIIATGEPPASYDELKARERAARLKLGSGPISPSDKVADNIWSLFV